MEDGVDLSGVLQAALDLQVFCESRGWDFCFIGGLAYQPWGDPRATQAADLSLFTGYGNEEFFIDELLSEYSPRRAGGREFGLRSRVLLLWSKDKIAVDIALAALPFEKRAVERSQKRLAAPGCELRVCSAEELIVHKAFAARDRDWADIDGVLLKHAKNLNVAQILEELAPLVALKEEPEILVKLEALMKKRGAL